MNSDLNLQLFDTLLEPTFVLNAAGFIVYCNEPAATLAGLSIRKILNKKSLQDLFQFSEKIVELNTLDEVTEPSPYYEVHFINNDQTEGRVQITIQKLADQMWIVFFRDVTLEEKLQRKYRAELQQKENFILDLEKAHKELEHYSKNLEKMVEERTFELRQLNQTLSALVDSLGQGFFIISKDGLCHDVYSKACLEILESSPAKKKAAEVLRIPSEKMPGFEKWLIAVFAEMLPFKDLVPLAPSTFSHSKNKSVSLDYFPIRNSENIIEGVVVVATDITNLVHAENVAEVERANAKMITTIVKNKKEIGIFIREAQNILARLKELSSMKVQDFSSHQEEIYRLLHTLKGGAASFSIHSLTLACHKSEDIIQQNNDFSSQGLLAHLYSDVHRAFTNFINDNQEIIGKSLTTRMIEIPIESVIEVYEKLSAVDAHFARLFLENFAMEPVGRFFQHFDESIQHMAELEHKKIAPIHFTNDSLLIFPEPYSALFASLIHAIRNAVDHGIESPEKRLIAKKSEEGHISIRFIKLQDTLHIEIQDDGAGIATERLRAKLESRGVNCANKSDSEVIQHVFESQVSTTDKVTTLSGRGVGMDAILHCARDLGGKAWVESKSNVGTKLIVSVPYIESVDQLKSLELNKNSQTAQPYLSKSPKAS